LKKFLVIVLNYPNENNIYGGMYIHSRVKGYIEKGLNVEVFSFNNNLFCNNSKHEFYNYESVFVEVGNLDKLKKKIENNRYEKILIHYSYWKVLREVRKINLEIPIIAWFHGFEIIGWYRRLYNFRMSRIFNFFGYVVFNSLQRFFLHMFFKDDCHLEVVFVSKWLAEVALKDTHIKKRNISYSVISNPVDDKMFKYNEKKEEDRLNIFTLKSFDSRNYANDITARVILKLSKKKYFNDLTFTICGKGRLWNKETKKLKLFSNVILRNRFFSHSEIVDLHKNNGVVLMPSRQDTQGLSTCEAMSSGLVPISSNNSAIPEFVSSRGGYLCENVDEIVDVIEDIYYDKNKFLEFSVYSSKFIQDKCSLENIIDKETKLILE